MSYETLQSQPSRLGEFSGEFGEFGDEISAAINAISTGAVGFIQAVEGGKTMRTQARWAGRVAITSAIEGTKKLGISTRGQVALAKQETEGIKVAYGSITKLILGAGAVLSGLLIAGAFAFSMVKGDDEYIYE